MIVLFSCESLFLRGSYDLAFAQEACRRVMIECRNPKYVVWIGQEVVLPNYLEWLGYGVSFSINLLNPLELRKARR